MLPTSSLPCSSHCQRTAQVEGTFTILLENHGSLNDSWQRRSKWSRLSLQLGPLVLASLLLLLLFSQVLRSIFLIKSAFMGLGEMPRGHSSCLNMRTLTCISASTEKLCAMAPGCNLSVGSSVGRRGLHWTQGLAGQLSLAEVWVPSLAKRPCFKRIVKVIKKDPWQPPPAAPTTDIREHICGEHTCTYTFTPQCNHGILKDISKWFLHYPIHTVFTDFLYS